MATQSEIVVVGSTQIAVGLSAIVGIGIAARDYNKTFKILGGGGTLEITSLPGALSGAGATGWGIGYPVGASEIVSINGPAHFYLAASGATMTVAMYIGRTAGASYL